MFGVWLTCALVAAVAAHCDRPGCHGDGLRKLIDDDNPMAMVSRITHDDVTAPSTTTEINNSTPKIPVFNVSTTTQSDPTESTKPKGRLLNLNIDDVHSLANAIHNQTHKDSKKKLVTDLSDVSMDDEDEDISKYTENDNIADKFFGGGNYPNHQVSIHPPPDHSQDGEFCEENGFSYKPGDHIKRGCEEICECVNGKWGCHPRCQHPYIRRGRKLDDPLCFESPVDECCSIIACAADTKVSTATSQGVELCRFVNDTHTVGSTWNIGCEQTCTCEKNSIVSCKPRCPKLAASDKCINVPDPKDACCEMQVCDVSQDAHEESADNFTATTVSDKTKPQSNVNTAETTMRPLVLAEPITSVKVLQNNSVLVDLIHPNNTKDPIHLQLSKDGGRTYNDIQLRYPNIIENLTNGNYVVRTKETGTKFNFTISSVADEKFNKTAEPERVGCRHDGIFYAVGEEFHIGCAELCECTGPDTRECAVLECPSHVGLELVSKGCVTWAPTPPPSPPNCCPRSARCLSDGTCHYKGQAIPNWTEVPISLTGCEQRCFCENGELDCQEVCSPLSLLPPQDFRCPPGHHPAHVNISYEDCCKEWGCIKNGLNTAAVPPVIPNLPLPGFLPTILPDIHFPREDDENIPSNLRPTQESVIPSLHPKPGRGEENNKLTMISLQADSPTSVKMLFGLPPVLVGLRGSVDLRYTDTNDDDVSHWHSQVFAPVDEILTTSRLEFRLTGLKPSTKYRLKGKLYLHNLPVEPESEIFSVKTLDLPMIEEKHRDINSQLTVVEVNDTTAHLTWRHFADDELPFIDGIQVRYRPVGQPIYTMTELLHHSRSNAELKELRPGTRYEASLVLVPPLQAATELRDLKTVEFTTAPHIDPYNWSVTIEAKTVGSQAAELHWHGIPEPSERWVRVYRAAHECGTGRAQEHDAFRLATRDQDPTITITGLKADTRCRVWLELFLVNGKVKTSNVLEITTKSLDSDHPIDNIIEASSVSGSRDAHAGGRGDYYGALVVVGVVAALGALASLLLLLVVIRRHRPHSVPITPVPTVQRDSTLPPYDNPAYKLELQQETMDL